MKHRVSAFEFLQAEIKHERELRQRNEEVTETALVKQALEYERRLTDQLTIYTKSQELFEVWKTETTNESIAREAVTASNQKLWNMAVIVLSLLITIAGIFFRK